MVVNAAVGTHPTGMRSCSLIFASAQCEHLSSFSMTPMEAMSLSFLPPANGVVKVMFSYVSVRQSVGLSVYRTGEGSPVTITLASLQTSG